MRKELDTKKIKKILEKLPLIFEIVDLKADNLKRASTIDFKDYDDVIQSTLASRIKANYIITRNIKDYNKSKVPSPTPFPLSKNNRNGIHVFVFEELKN